MKYAFGIWVLALLVCIAGRMGQIVKLLEAMK